MNVNSEADYLIKKMLDRSGALFANQMKISFYQELSGSKALKKKIRIPKKDTFIYTAQTRNTFLAKA